MRCSISTARAPSRASNPFSTPVSASCHIAISFPRSLMPDRPKIAVVIPCYRVCDKIVDVVDSVLSVADFIIAVDDCCPEKSGEFLRKIHTEPKVTILFHQKHQGV